MIWLFFGVALAECADDAVGDVLTRSSALERAYVALREDDFAAEHLALTEAIACLDGALTLEQAVEVHSAKALAAFVDGELAAARKSWAAVRQLAPAFVPDPALMPPGHPFRVQFDEAVVDDERVELERSPEGGWRVDAVETADVPKNRAFLLQGFDLSGGVVHSGYHYSVAEVPQIDFAELDETARQRRRRRMHWIGSVSAGALAVGSGTAVVMAASAQASVKSPETPLGEIEGKSLAANTMSYASLGMLGGAVAVGSVTWAIRW